jgi:hypothetical protein
MASQFYVLLADVERSRRVRDRDALQLRLQDACAELNSAYARQIRAGFKILKGVDEVGAVLRSIAESYAMVMRFQERIRPASARFALARGEVDTAPRSGDVARMDGAAFHKAARIMAGLKQSKLTFGMDVGDALLDQAISGAVNVISILQAGRSERQVRTICEYEKSGSQTEVARLLGITQQGVSWALQRSHHRQIRIIEEALNQTLSEYARRLREAGGGR